MMTSQILKSVDFTKVQKPRYLENEILFFLQIKKMEINHALTSTQLISASIQLFTTPLTLLEPKYRIELRHFPKFSPKNSELAILTENWHTWYLDDADSYSDINFLNFKT